MRKQIWGNHLQFNSHVEIPYLLFGETTSHVNEGHFSKLNVTDERMDRQTDGGVSISPVTDLRHCGIYIFGYLRGPSIIRLCISCFPVTCELAVISDSTK